MKLSVYKFDPAVDAAPYYVEGEIEWHEQMSALEALVQFSNTVAPINFDYSCATRLCGRCAMMIDGNPCLPCVTPIEDGEHTFEPLAGYTVIRDLVVDKSEAHDQLSQIYDRVRIEEFTRETLETPAWNPDDHDTLLHLEFCARCGICDSTCPAKQMYPNEYVGPMAMLAIGYRFLDPLDTGDRVMEAVSKGLFRCIMCGKCDEVCQQQDISHLELWQRLRDAATERGIVPSYAQ